jgi:hypothetical protein
MPDVPIGLIPGLHRRLADKSDAPDELVPRGRVADEFNVCPRTVARWEAAKLPGFDDPVTINKRKYHRRSRFEPVKRGLPAGGQR